MPDLPNAHDPALDRCANCGATFESHPECPFCEGRICPAEIEDAEHFRTETDADRQAAWAGSHGL